MKLGHLSSYREHEKKIPITKEHLEFILNELNSGKCWERVHGRVRYVFNGYDATSRVFRRGMRKLGMIPENHRHHFNKKPELYHLEKLLIKLKQRIKNIDKQIVSLKEIKLLKIKEIEKTTNRIVKLKKKPENHNFYY